ncbi:hypothetical protein AAFF_G00404280 [Aldrovandia affinis]|uniref:Uncharacterized protein n=1 Tax=Aldrovandia affinis TaxID=143900 RepID=A0AAD7WZV7_9TELE|nr:hypothetical protein AAFF_G00404280 [Aldrovandia affinis]
MKIRAERRRLVRSADASPQRPHYHWPVYRSIDRGLVPYLPATPQHIHWGYGTGMCCSMIVLLFYDAYVKGRVSVF